MARLIVTLPLNVVYSGGTALVYEYTNPEWGIKNMTTYINSQRHLRGQGEGDRCDGSPFEPFRV